MGAGPDEQGVRLLEAESGLDDFVLDVLGFIGSNPCGSVMIVVSWVRQLETRCNIPPGFGGIFSF